MDTNLLIDEVEDSQQQLIRAEKTRRLEALASETNDPNFAYYLAQNVDGIDIRFLGKIVINSGNLKYNYYFARDILGADVRAHGKVIINSRNLIYNYRFARGVKGANIMAHHQVIIDSGDEKYNRLFDKIIQTNECEDDYTTETKHVKTLTKPKNF